MLPASLYRGPRNGDSSNSEAQFQGRVVENAWVNQHEIMTRKSRLNDKIAHPYKETSTQGPDICTLKTNEICVKPRNFKSNDTDTFTDLYRPGKFDISSSGDDNGYPYILSAMNGEYINDMTQADFDLLTYEERRAVVRNKWQLAGIVGTNNDSLGFHGEIGRPDLPVQLGGVYTISNFGEKPIFQGDLVVWNAPVMKYNRNGEKHEPVHVDETPDEKCVIATEPYDPKAVLGWDAIKSAIRELQILQPQNPPGAPRDRLDDIIDDYAEIKKRKSLVQGTLAVCLVSLAKIHLGMTKQQWTNSTPAQKRGILVDLLLVPEIEDTLEEFFISLAEQRAEYNSRIVGRALTIGLPGNNFNIYMGNYCV